ncbi:hypothetical protein Zmor_001347 [Zophobas morio]|uniref:Tc1-like transposase DDE domain-containing protein n=1 Tax=Zophobas morio TaxID=2755281 RepID=A0AA38IYE2_9CUCU|nr:hypothetical protein Zmor_001347 [Zophobas morio]
MNQQNFLKWFENQLLMKLEEPSLIIMDNASYHSTLANKCPNGSWKKAEIREWLEQLDISSDPQLLKTELLHLVAQNKPPKTYVADELAHQYGHRVLRLPPYHCVFNPIENIWGIAKNYYSKHIGREGYGHKNAVEMWKEALAHVTPTMWKNTVDYTNKIIQQWWERELLFDREEIAPLIIDINEDSDYSFSDYDSEDDNTAEGIQPL